MWLARVMLPVALLLAACGPDPNMLAGDRSKPVHYALLEASEGGVTEAVLATMRRRLEPAGPGVTRVRLEGSQIRLDTRATAAELDRMVSNFLQPGVVTFNLVDMNADVARYRPGIVRSGKVALPDRTTYGDFLVVSTQPIIKAGDITHAFAAQDDYGRPSISFQLGGEGTETFAKATQRYMGARFAIVFDKQIISAPTIETPIMGGSGRITGVFTQGEAEALAAVVRTGPLPELKIVKRGVGETELKKQ